jgi:hypothetical protein
MLGAQSREVLVFIWPSNSKTPQLNTESFRLTNVFVWHIFSGHSYHLSIIWCQFVSAWADTKIHFGNGNTSRAEGQHKAAFKNYLKVSTSGIRDVCNRIELSLQNQRNKYEAKLSCDRMRVYHCLNVPFYRSVIRKTSTFAMLQVHKQFRIAKQPQTEAQRSFKFTSSMEMPCSHAIKSKMTLNEVLSVDDSSKLANCRLLSIISD